LSCVTFTNSSATPSTLPRTVAFTLEDASGGVSPAEIKTVTVTCRKKISVVLVMDQSISLGNSGLADEKSAAKDFIDSLDAAAGDRVGLVTFCGCIKADAQLNTPPAFLITQPLTSDTAFIKTKIDEIDAPNELCAGTIYHSPLKQAKTLLLGETGDDVERVILLLTDGEVTWQQCDN